MYPIEISNGWIAGRPAFANEFGVPSLGTKIPEEMGMEDSEWPVYFGHAKKPTQGGLQEINRIVGVRIDDTAPQRVVSRAIKNRP